MHACLQDVTQDTGMWNLCFLSQIYNSIIILCGCNHNKFVIINNYKHDSRSYLVRRRKGCNSKILIVIHCDRKRRSTFHSNYGLKGGTSKHEDSGQLSINSSNCEYSISSPSTEINDTLISQSFINMTFSTVAIDLRGRSHIFACHFKTLDILLPHPKPTLNMGPFSS